MALCASGTMSLGGTTTGRSVNCELGCSGTAAICMNRSDVRTLAGKASGAIAMSDFYGKSSFNPGPLGSFCCGGYYTGVMCVCETGRCYYLFVSQLSGGQAGGCCWGPNDCFALTGLSSCDQYTDGYCNTYTCLNCSAHPAANFTATRSLNGYTDWYLPSRCEVIEMYRAACCTTACGSGGFVPSTWYWASSERSGQCNSAYAVIVADPASGQAGELNKSLTNFCSRAMRREAI